MNNFPVVVTTASTKPVQGRKRGRFFSEKRAREEELQFAARVHKVHRLYDAGCGTKDIVDNAKNLEQGDSGTENQNQGAKSSFHGIQTKAGGCYPPNSALLEERIERPPEKRHISILDVPKPVTSAMSAAYIKNVPFVPKENRRESLWKICYSRSVSRNPIPGRVQASSSNSSPGIVPPRSLAVPVIATTGNAPPRNQQELGVNFGPQGQIANQQNTDGLRSLFEVSPSTPFSELPRITPFFYGDQAVSSSQASFGRFNGLPQTQQSSRYFSNGLGAGLGGARSTENNIPFVDNRNFGDMDYRNLSAFQIPYVNRNSAPSVIFPNGTSGMSVREMMDAIVNKDNLNYSIQQSQVLEPHEDGMGYFNLDSASAGGATASSENGLDDDDDALFMDVPDSSSQGL